MITVTVTLFFAACCALMQCLLTVLVIRRRLKAGVYFLDGGDDPLLRCIRAHGNFAETAPMALLLMALLEISGLGSVWLMAFGVTLLLGRVLHATSLLTNHATWSRSLGMALTIGVISIEAVCGLWMLVR
ncbi:COG3788 Uncharacterized relative of glutathione S-transferase, MAPEG superfamily [Comamonadaceae bacterium]